MSAPRTGLILSLACIATAGLAWADPPAAPTLVSPNGVVEWITEAGYRVLPARSGREALQILNAEHPRPELMITDLSMPDGDTPAWHDRCSGIQEGDRSSIPPHIFLSKAGR